VLALMLLAAAPSLAGDLRELAKKAGASVIHLKVASPASKNVSTGTGFFVSTDGRIVTNHHVISKGTEVTATLADGRRIEVLGLLAKDRDNDVAILQAEKGTYQALELGDSSKVQQGDRVVVLGNPRGLSHTLSEGIVSAIRQRGLKEEEQLQASSWRIQITAPISPGSSGSPIMTQDGKVIAIAVGLLSNAQNLNFGIPIEIAKDMLSSIPQGAEPMAFTTAASGSVWTNLGISAIFFTGLGMLFVGARWFRGRRRPRPARGSR